MRYVALLRMAAACCASCVPTATGEEGVAATPDPGRLPLSFSFQTVDGNTISSRDLVGRVTVIGLLASFDVPSQIQARALASIVRHHVPRMNLVVLMLESRENRPLVDVFATSVGLTCPIAMVGDRLATGEPVLPGAQGIPSVIVLDRDGRIAWQHNGFVSERALDAALRAAETRR